MSELDNIIHTLKDTYDGSAWHGSSVKAVLSKLNQKDVDAKIGNGHSIGELILHMAAWRTFAIKKLRGDDHYDVSDEFNFPGCSNLRDAIDELDKTQIALISAITNFNEQKLREIVPQKKYSYQKMLVGIPHHDLYHLGQIVMIMKQF